MSSGWNLWGGQLILQGADEGFQDVRDSVGWTAALSKESGKFVVTASGDEVAFIVYGACTPLPIGIITPAHLILRDQFRVYRESRRRVSVNIKHDIANKPRKARFMWAASSGDCRRDGRANFRFGSARCAFNLAMEN